MRVRPFSHLASLTVAAWGALAGAGIGAAPARSDEALNLTWFDCPAGAGESDDAFLCNTNDGEHTLFLTFTLAQPLTGVIGLEAVVDLQSADIALPPWWQLGAGGCRVGVPVNLVADASFAGSIACANPWRGTPASLIQGFTVGPPDHGVSNQARIKAVASVPSDSASDLAAGTAYYGLKIIIRNGQTTGGPSACAGCLPPLCLVLNSILVRRLPGAPGGDAMLTTPGPGNGTWATWRGGTGADCALVPVRNRTWGQLKALYR